MLCLNRKESESILLGGSEAEILNGAFIRVAVIGHNEYKARIGISAPDDVRVIRRELLSNQNATAAAKFADPTEPLFRAVPTESAMVKKLDDVSRALCRFHLALDRGCDADAATARLATNIQSALSQFWIRGQMAQLVADNPELAKRYA